jgi:hypothetical protein
MVVEQTQKPVLIVKLNLLKNFYCLLHSIIYDLIIHIILGFLLQLNRFIQEVCVPLVCALAKR